MTRDLQPVEHYLTGPADQLANVLRSAHARGHLVRYSLPQPIGGGRYAIDVTILEPVPERKGRRRAAQIAVILAGLVAASAVAWIVWLLVAWLAAHWVVIALVLIVAGAIAARDETHSRGRR
jgi:hypothetical protein